MPRQFDYERAAEAVALSDFYRSNDRAANECGIAIRTLERYRAQTRTDRTLADRVAAKKAELDKSSKDWAPVAMATLRSMVEKLDSLVQQADKTQIREVAGAIKIVGDLELVRSHLQADRPVETDETSTTNITVVNQIANGQPALPH
jgi:hypothetical protein